MRRYLEDQTASWSVGIWGGIGEFRTGDDEPRTFDPDTLTIVSPRGALRITPADGAIALEIRSSQRDRVDEIAFCLPAATLPASPLPVLREAGPDTEALRVADRDSILFDLGLGAPHVDAFVRISLDEEPLLAQLRAACGRSLLDGYDGTAAALAAASPPRIFRSPLARLEVYTPIPLQDGRSPEGPHTHILPALLRQGLAHAPDTPIPEGWLCCLSVYPGMSGGEG
jgi:hypothetical protein